MDINDSTQEISNIKIMESEGLRKLMKFLIKEETEIRAYVMKNLSNISNQDASGYVFNSKLTTRSSAPVIPINDFHDEEGSKYSHEERLMRCQLATLYRLMDLHGWTLNIYNHITMRNKGDSKEFFINPLGLLYHEITASSLVKIDLGGSTLDPGTTVFGINKAGWNLHAAIHEIRHDIRCIIHTHVPDVIAVGCLKYGLLPVSAEAVELLDESCDSLSQGVRYHDYWGVAVNKDEWASLKEDIGPRSRVLILRNHGVIVGGDSCVEAWTLMKRVVMACEIQIRLLQEKGEEGLLAMVDKKFDTSGDYKGNSTLKTQRITEAEIEFEAQMRILDQTGYRTGYQYCHGDMTVEDGHLFGPMTTH